MRPARAPLSFRRGARPVSGRLPELAVDRRSGAAGNGHHATAADASEVASLPVLLLLALLLGEHAGTVGPADEGAGHRADAPGHGLEDEAAAGIAAGGRVERVDERGGGLADAEARPHPAELVPRRRPER